MLVRKLLAGLIVGSLCNMTHTLTVEQNELTGECYIALPEELLNQVGWIEGDEIIWKHQKDGSFMLKKKGSKKQ